MRLAIAAVLLMLTGCRSLIADAQGFSTIGQVRQPVLVEYSYTSLSDLKAACPPHTGACAWWNGDMCEIHYERGDEYSRRHELHHCVKGTFHP